MGIFDFLWRPKEGKVYKSRRWNRKNNIKWAGGQWQGQGFWKAGFYSSNISKVFIEIDGIRQLGTFKVTSDTCSIGIVGRNHKVKILYRTPTKNLDFYKKDKGSRSKGTTLRIHTHFYDYIVTVKDSSKLTTEKMPSKIVRRRGTAIVDTPKGILVASGRHKLFLLPGGGANKGESREKATIRELREETELKAISCKYLFEYNEPEDGRKIRNLHKVFLIKAKDGIAKPHSDVKHIAYWKPGSDLKLSNTTRTIIDKYLKEKA